MAEGASRQHARRRAGPGTPGRLAAGTSPSTSAPHIRKAPIIPDTLDALDALEVLRQAEVPMALVHDEYGHFDGVVTPADILDAIAGAFRSDEGDSRAGGGAAGGWLLAPRRLDAGRRDGRAARDRPAGAARLRDRGRAGDRRTPAPARAPARPSRPWAGASRSSTWTAGGSTRCWPGASTSKGSLKRNPSRPTDILSHWADCSLVHGRGVRLEPHHRGSRPPLHEADAMAVFQSPARRGQNDWVPPTILKHPWRRCRRVRRWWTCSGGKALCHRWRAGPGLHLAG